MRELDNIMEEIRNEIEYNPEIGKEQGEGMARAMNIIRKHMNDGWIPVEERLPDHLRDCEVTLSNGERSIAYYNIMKEAWYSPDYYIRDVIAWKEPSEPYCQKNVGNKCFQENLEQIHVKKIDILKEEIANYSAEELAKLISSYGKCLRCANFFKIPEKYDKPHCYENIRNSNCIKGITEYLNSYESFVPHYDGVHRSMWNKG